MKAALTAKMSPATARAVLRWLYILCGLILGIVTVGGITRLTQSGLSMVDWRLFMDMLPPLTHDDWLRTFAKYQQYPQYLKENAGMTLEQFKFIFFWEYIHRMYGRVIGLFYMFPLIYWAVRRELNRPLGLRLAGGFGFVCLQGFVGWFMVKSGLVNEPRVSHFRLATHLGLALALLAYHAWLALDLREALGLAKAPKKKTLWTADLLWIGRILLAVVCLQILWGAFTAGLRAGWGYNTFPTMDGQWIPDAIGREDGFWRNVFYNSVAVQFTHRMGGWLLLFGSWAYVFRAKMTGGPARAAHMLAGTVTIQFILGALTVAYVVPLPLAALHQFWACTVVLAAVNLAHALARRPAT